MMSSNKSVAFEIPKIDSGKDEGNVDEPEDGKKQILTQIAI